MLDARYRVGSMIARGGMSTVYRGTDTRLDRPVAIKIMDSRLAADPAFRRRFEREARSAARIDHPNVVGVHDQGDCPGPDGPALFLVMELVDGATLRDLLRLRGPLGVPAAIAVMERVLAGLAEAHRLGLVHRDVKPENVLISRSGEVKVADFGLVVAAAEAGASHVGMIMGTVAYLSPEQVTTGSADARSDVYAAGVLFYELLTGEPPYRGETAISVAYRHVNNDVPAPSLVAGDVPPELDELVARATRRDPAGRPADAGQLLAELRRLAEFLEVPRVAVPVPPPPLIEDVDTNTLPRVPPAGPADAAAVSAGPRGTRALPRPADHGTAVAALAPYVQERRRGSRVFRIWTAVILALTLAVGASAWWLGSGRWTIMPRVAGLEQTAALNLLDQADLVGKPATLPHDDVPEGQVIEADQQPDADLLRGTTVTITVSTGQPEVPAIAPGTSVADAEAAIRAAGFTPRNNGAAEYSDTVPEGTVLRTEPEAGTRQRSGETVELVLSRGKEPQQVRVPNLFNDDFEDAVDELEGLGLQADEEPTVPFFGTGGRVIGQDHGAGSLVDPGTVIVLQTTPF
jgi:serine/threonine-protein kinase